MQLKSEKPARSARGADEGIQVALLRLGHQMRRIYRSTELELAALPILHTLGGCGATRLSELASSLELDPSTVSRQVRQLVDRGLVRRTDDPDDRRATRLELTDDGRTAYDDVMERRRARVHGVLGGWSKADRAEFHRLLTRFVDDLASG